MKNHRHTLLALSLLAAVPAMAQTLSIVPTPGLWETDSQMSLNGQDLGALMRKSMDDMLKSLPADQRAMAEQMMKGRGMPGMGGKAQDCLTAAEAARRSDPEQLLAELQKDSPQCRYEPVKVDGASLSFKGRCQDPEGFTGDITGEMTLTSPKAWTGRWAGVGRMRGAEQIPGLTVTNPGQVNFGWTGSGRWVAASCGSVPPR
jgi:hypothetical protein